MTLAKTLQVSVLGGEPSYVTLGMFLGMLAG